MLDLMEALLEHRTPGGAALMLRLAKSSTPDALSHTVRRFFGVLADHPDLPEVAAAAEFCFGNRRSPWHLTKCDYLRATEFGDARLLRLPAFRKAMAAALSNEKVTGRLTVEGEKLDSCSIQWKYGGSSSMGIGKDELVGVEPGEEMPVRACDALLEGVRNSVFSGDEGPDFHIYWPLEKRNAARAEWLICLGGPASK
jgi:hypothetical protein